LEQDYASCGSGFDKVNQEPILGAGYGMMESEYRVCKVEGKGDE
jgi:hypothetical protein